MSNQEEIGKALFLNNTMADDKGIIVAEQMIDDSDPQTDYFASHAGRIVILAFTKKTRDDFKEMRKACVDCDIEEIRSFSIPPVTDENGRERNEENSRFWTAKDEHREKYSMGAGYYLGRWDRTGWNIRKRIFNQYTKMEDFYIHAGKENGFYASRPRSAILAREKA
jgi:hypothetical protein